MDVLLQEDVDNLGHRGQVVRVRAGYGRNYLLPQKLAIEASTGNKRMIEERQRALVKREVRERVTAQSEASKLDGLELTFTRRTGEHGALYGSVSAHDVIEAIGERGITVERRRIGLHEPIKLIGDYDVVVKLHRDIAPTIKVHVVREGAPEEALPVETEDAAAASHEAAENQPVATDDNESEE
jgi:large subunit ribosomal protein L9